METPETINQEELLHQKELAARLGMGAKTVRKYFADTPYIKVGKQRRFYWPVVDAWLKEQTVKPYISSSTLPTHSRRVLAKRTGGGST